MPRVSFSELPDHGRLWVFPADRALADDESAHLLDEVDAFLEGWAAHGAPLRSARELREGRFLLVAVDEDAEAPSGCSIDALVNRLRQVGSRMGVELVAHGAVWYREGETVRSESRAAFRARASAGEVGPHTAVFDTTLTRVGALRAGGLERPAAETWHGRAFFGVQTQG